MTNIRVNSRPGENYPYIALMSELLSHQETSAKMLKVKNLAINLQGPSDDWVV